MLKPPTVWNCVVFAAAVVAGLTAWGARPRAGAAPATTTVAEFVDLQRAARESIPGQAVFMEYQRGAYGRQQHANEIAAEAAKLPEGSKERQAKETEAQQVASQVQQQNQSAASKADEDFRKQVIAVLERLSPGALVLPVRPLTGGRELTDEVIVRLNAANEDAEGKLKEREAEIKRLKEQLAARAPVPPAPAAAFPPAPGPSPSSKGKP